MKKIFVTIIFVLILLLQVNVYANSISDLISPIQYSDEFRQYLNLSEEEKAKTSVVPRTYEVIKSDNQIKNPFKIVRMLGATAETSYTLKSIIPENLVIRNQGPKDTCWAFAEIASLETNLALRNYKNNIQAKAYDFSEKHMEYGVTRDFLNNQVNPYGFNRELNSGGNAIIATAYLTNGLGAVDENSVQLPDDLQKVELSNIQNKVVTSQVYDTKEFEKITSVDNTVKERIKDYIKNYGGLTASIFGAPISSDYYNNETGALYCDSEEECPITHSVIIVGWDDNYDVENFNEKHKPTSNGAWLVKNSYGTSQEFLVEDFRDEVFELYKDQQGWHDKSEVTTQFIKQVLTYSGYTLEGDDKATIEIGDEGYWHVSYEDINIYQELQGITKSDDKLSYENIYQYNYNGIVGTLSYDAQKIYLANVFDKKTSGDEYINQVALNVPEEVTCTVYVNPNGDSMLLDDLQKMQLQDGESETIDAGYHTLEFLNPIKVTGTSFVVMVEMKGTRANEIAYSVEANLPEVPLFSKVEIEDGKCFLSADGFIESGEWADLSKLTESNERATNVDTSIKAFTTSNVEGEKILSSIEIQTPPTKTEYIEGENFNTAGMVVIARYEDGTTEAITNYTIENGQNLTEGQTSIKIKYNGKEAIQNITVKKVTATGPVATNFENAKPNIKSLKLYTYTNKQTENYALAEVEISDILRNLDNDSYEYYYYVSTNSAETNIVDWVKIDTKQTAEKVLSFNINSKDIKNYDKIADAEKVYLYIKEVVTKDDIQKTTITKGMELKSKVETAEMYVDGKIYKAPQNNGQSGDKTDKDDTTMDGKLPQTGQGIMLIGITVLVVILGIVFAKKYMKYNEKM